MCQRVQCSSCGKPTYAGCGMHIEQVLRDVKPADRCHCREDKAKAKANGKADSAASGGGFLRGLFGK